MTEPQMSHAEHDVKRKHAKGHHSAPGNERIGSFSDGVFSIAITLLVLEVKVPDDITGGLITALPVILPKLLAHVISFAVLGIYWVGHHNMFLHIRRHDRWLLWMNILFLLFVASMPFAAALIIHYPDDQLALIFYALMLIGAGLALNLTWRYATKQRRLVPAELDADLIAFVNRRQLMAPMVYVIAVLVSFLNLNVAKLLFILVPLLYIVPSPLDQFHHKQLADTE
ncbi:MAG: DUF1211 domain-containing protein [Anaerolineae bacterium]|nr:DUF1211 domain-containing protein [Anaerolineae bacterium]